MGTQGVVVIAPDGTSTRVAVGRYSPTDFSFGSKTRVFFSSLLHREMVKYTGIALLLTFTFAALALAASGASRTSMACFVLAAAISAFLAATAGVYPHAYELPPGGDGDFVGSIALSFSGYGLVPVLLVVVGMAFARTSRRRMLAVAVAGIGMLPLVALGALVLFETGPSTANFVAVGLVGLAASGLWAYRERTHDG